MSIEITLLQDRNVLQTSRFSVHELQLQLASGQLLTKHTIHHPGAVVILPWFSDQRVVLLKNYRVAVRQTLWELPAGTLEPNELPSTTALRELSEETGYEATSMTPLGQFWMSPGILAEQMHAFVAQGLTLATAAPEPGELLEPVVLPWVEVLAMLDRGEIMDAKTIAVLLLWDRQLRRDQKQ